MEQLSSELVASARKGRRDAVVEVLAAHYPIVWRMATGLTGRADVGRGVTRFVMQRSLRARSSWTDDGAPTRWFHHHTLLTTRRTLKHAPTIENDTFLDGASSDAGYLAFVRALRSLPMQQREAFILTHGEKLDLRALAVAMDCSTTAAGNHLRAAADHLQALSGDRYAFYVSRMTAAYQSLGPDEELSLKEVRQRVRGWVARWLVERTIQIVISVALLIVLVWGVYWVWRIIEHSMHSGV